MCMGLPPHVLSPPPANLEEGVQRANGMSEASAGGLLLVEMSTDGVIEINKKKGKEKKGEMYNIS